MKVTESALTYVEVISLTLSNMKKRRDDLHQLNRLHWSQWNHFSAYLKELHNNFLRYLRGLQGKRRGFSICLSQHVTLICNWGPAP